VCVYITVLLCVMCTTLSVMWGGGGGEDGVCRVVWGGSCTCTCAMRVVWVVVVVASGLAFGFCVPPIDRQEKLGSTRCRMQSSQIHHAFLPTHTRQKQKQKQKQPKPRRPLVDRLLAAGADVNVKDHGETTPLLYVVQQGNR
jgi:hypothetical protein